jgi:hypothetical protein
MAKKAIHEPSGLQRDVVLFFYFDSEIRYNRTITELELQQQENLIDTEQRIVNLIVTCFIYTLQFTMYLLH